MGEACLMPLYYEMGGPSVILPGSVPPALDLLTLPFVFTQTGLLKAWEVHLRGEEPWLDAGALGAGVPSSATCSCAPLSGTCARYRARV